MKVLILAGGFGTRLSEETDLIPKPLVKIGEKPILWHIMKHYSAFGYNEFVILLGYKGDMIKNYFSVTLSPSYYYRLTVPPGIWHAFKGHNHDLNLILDVADMEHQPDEIIRIDLDKIPFDWSSL